MSSTIKHWRIGFPVVSPLTKQLNNKTVMRHRLHTKIGKILYAARKNTVEPVFGIIKHVLDFRPFSLRGLERVTAEWDLGSLEFNYSLKLKDESLENIFSNRLFNYYRSFRWI